MFGMGGSEILVILIVALLFLGPDKLPDAAKQISKGIRDLKKQTRVLQETIENDEHIGGAIRDLKSALRGDDVPVRPVVRKVPEPTKLPEGAVENQILPPAEPVAGAPEASASAPLDGAEATATAQAKAADEPAGEAPSGEPAKPAVTLPAMAGEPDPVASDGKAAEQLASLIKPAAGTVAKS
jgi:sec-independent protein translocase protein TatB